MTKKPLEERDEASLLAIAGQGSSGSSDTLRCGDAKIPILQDAVICCYCIVMHNSNLLIEEFTT